MALAGLYTCTVTLYPIGQTHAARYRALGHRLKHATRTPELKTITNRTAVLLLAIVTVVLTACGSGSGQPNPAAGSGTATPTTDVPTTAPATATPVATPTLRPTATPSPTPTPAPTRTPTPGPAEITLEPVFTWYAPDRATHFEEAPDGSGRFFISEQDGRIIELTGGPDASDGAARIVLDITDRVLTEGVEEGLLGFAVHLEFGQSTGNDRLFVNYTADEPRRSVLSEFGFAPNGTLDLESERIVLELPQPGDIHNGGMLEFGPDGYLYAGFGDGGDIGDPEGHGQNTSNIYGTIIRIDVTTPDEPYVVPPDNPFAAGGEAPEIWAYGLRNPWRFSFDRANGNMWAGDVGERAIEEVNFIVRGGNYGWNTREGYGCFEPQTGCAETGFIDPVATYIHVDGCAVIGGYVYRGDRVPSLDGAYIYGDYCSGRIWIIRNADGSKQRAKLLMDTRHFIGTFGQGLDGEVYVLAYGSETDPDDKRQILRFVLQ